MFLHYLVNILIGITYGALVVLILPILLIFAFISLIYDICRHARTYR